MQTLCSLYVTTNTNDSIFTKGNILDNSKSTISVLNDLKANRLNTVLHTMMLALGFEHGDSSVSASQTLNFEEHLNSFAKISKIVLQSCSIDNLSVMSVDSNAAMKMKDSVKIWNLDTKIQAKPKLMLSRNLSELDKVALNIVYPPVRIPRRYDPKLGKTGLYYCNRKVMSSHNYPHKNIQKACGPQYGPNCPACRTLSSEKINELNAKSIYQNISGMIYCGQKMMKRDKDTIDIWSSKKSTSLKQLFKDILWWYDYHQAEQKIL